MFIPPGSMIGEVRSQPLTRALAFRPKKDGERKAPTRYTGKHMRSRPPPRRIIYAMRAPWERHERESYVPCTWLIPSVDFPKAGKTRKMTLADCSKGFRATN